MDLFGFPALVKETPSSWEMIRILSSSMDECRWGFKTQFHENSIGEISCRQLDQSIGSISISGIPMFGISGGGSGGVTSPGGTMGPGGGSLPSGGTTTILSQ